MNWTKHIISGAKVYVNATNTVAVVFPPFGRCHKLSSSQALDFATDFIIGSDNEYSVSYVSYLNSLEDTVAIQIDKVA